MGADEEMSALLLAVASDAADSKVEELVSSLEDPSARASLAAEVGEDGKVLEECSSEGGKRVASVLASALVLEAKSDSAEHVDSLASALCRLAAKQDLGSSEPAGLTEEAKGEISRLLASSHEAATAAAEAFLLVARTNQEWHAPALVLADACLAAEPSSDLRRDLVDLLGRRIFASPTPATAEEMALCSPLLHSLTKEEFDSSIPVPLKHNLNSCPGPTMVTLAALIQHLNHAGKGAYLKSYLDGSGNIVPSALKQLTADDTKHSSAASDVMVATVKACPNEGAQVVSKALASAIHQQPSAPLYDCIEEVGTLMLDRKGTPEAAKYPALANDDVIPVLEKGNEEDATAALSVWTEFQGAGAAAAASTAAADARIKQQAKLGAAATAPGVQSADDLDERIQKKVVVASHQQGGAEKPESIKIKEADGTVPLVKPGETFNDEPGNSAIQQGGSGEPTGNVDHGVSNEPDLEHGEGGMNEGPGLVEAVQVEDENEEFIPAAVEFDPDSKKPPIYKDPKIRNCGICVICLVLLLAVGLSVGLTQTLGTKKKEVRSSQAPSSQPTQAPTSDREKSLVNDLIVDILKDPDPPVDDSPQGKARDFILNKDILQLTIDDDTQEEDKERITQRFVLAAFAYATNSEEWHYCGTPADPNGNCIYDFFDRAANKYVETLASSWLGKGHECDWFGVRCDDEKKVVSIELIDNNLNGTFIKEMSLLKDVQSINLPVNALKGTLPSEIGEMKDLKLFRIPNNDFTGELPDELYELTLLENIVLGFNDFSGQISTKIGQLTSLKGFHMFNSQMDGPIPTEIGELTFLTELRIHDCAFTGTLPSEITKLETLTSIWGQRTLMTGQLPEDIGNMIDLEVLYINEARYSGTLPDSFYALAKFKELFAWDIKNSFNEPISPGIGGVIKPEIGNMQEMTRFVARGNAFQGQLPMEFGDITQLAIVWLHFNDITGVSPFCDPSTPTIGRQQYASIEMDCLAGVDEDNVVIPPKVQCECCQLCCDAAGICRQG